MKHLIYLILISFILSINSCYVEDEFVLNNQKPFYWVESIFEIGKSPSLYIVQLVDNRKKWPNNALVTVENRTDFKTYVLTKKSQSNSYTNDSLLPVVNKLYVLKVQIEDAVLIDSVFTYSHDFNFKLKIDPFNENESVLMGNVTGNNPNNLVLFRPLFTTTSPLIIETLEELKSNTDLRFQYLCGKRTRSDSYQKYLQFTDAPTFHKLSKLFANINQYEAKNSLLSPINYEDNVLEKKITGFFGYFGRINSNVLKDLDDSKIIKTIKVIRESDNVDITNQLDTFSLFLVSTEKLGKYAPYGSYDLKKNLNVSSNEISNLKLYALDGPYGCIPNDNYTIEQQGVIIHCTSNTINYSGSAVFSDSNLEETLTIKVKPF